MFVNVNYVMGRLVKGDEGVVLKKFMVDRRVDLGNKYFLIFG